MNSALLSSKNDCWSTPHYIFDPLDRFYHFDLDVCALPENAKCPRFFSPDDDGLIQPWSGVCWMNPPYGRSIGRWVKKAYDSMMSCDAVVVALLPARTDTSWFHDYIYNKPFVSVSFLRSRIRFENALDRAPFPSMLVVFDRHFGG